MALILTEQEIADLTQETKDLPTDTDALSQMKQKRAQRESEITLLRKDGSMFKIILRQSLLNVLDFSIILGYVPPKSNLLFRLRRYNGKSHEHTNKIEGNSFLDFHIHMATERYQDAGWREDGYAKVTNDYSDIHSAWNIFSTDCRINLPDNNQLKMF